MASRLVLSSGDEVFVMMDVPDAVAEITQARVELAALSLLLVKLVPWCEYDEEPVYGAVDPAAVISVLPLTDRELEAERRDREVWLEGER